MGTITYLLLGLEIRKKQILNVMNLILDGLIILMILMIIAFLVISHKIILIVMIPVMELPTMMDATYVLKEQQAMNLVHQIVMVMKEEKQTGMIAEYAQVVILAMKLIVI